MLYNIPEMRNTYSAFIASTFSRESQQNGLHYGIYGPGDQGAYNHFYRVSGQYKADVRPSPFFNWRPYWKGKPHDKRPIALVHWHGPKPHHFDKYQDNIFSEAQLDSYNLLLMNCKRQYFTDICWQWNRLWKEAFTEVKAEKVRLSMKLGGVAKKLKE